MRFYTTYEGVYNSGGNFYTPATFDMRLDLDAVTAIKRNGANKDTCIVFTTGGSTFTLFDNYEKFCALVDSKEIPNAEEQPKTASLFFPVFLSLSERESFGSLEALKESYLYPYTHVLEVSESEKGNKIFRVHGTKPE